MNELMQNIFDKWKEASLNEEMANFTIMYTHTAEEFMGLLETWGVPYKAIYNEFRISLVLMNYYKFIRNKEYYCESNISNEIMENYYV